MLPLWVRVDLGVMAMKAYSTFPNASGLELHHQMEFSVISRTLIGGVGGGAHLSAVMQFVYSIAPADCAVALRIIIHERSTKKVQKHFEYFEKDWTVLTYLCKLSESTLLYIHKQTFFLWGYSVGNKVTLIYSMTISPCQQSLEYIDSILCRG